MEPIKTIKLDDNHYVDVVYDENPDSPRNWDHSSKLCIREHRRYSFPNELQINFEDEEDFLDKTVGYHVFWLDCYEHSGIQFSLSGEGMQCRFDTSRKCGFIAVPKHIEWDNGPGYTGTKDYTEEEAREIARGEIQYYNQYLNGDVYGYIIYETFPTIEQDGKTYTAEPELLDSCYGFYDKEAIADNIPAEYREKFHAGI